MIASWLRRGERGQTRGRRAKVGKICGWNKKQTGGVFWIRPFRLPLASRSDLPVRGLYHYFQIERGGNGLVAHHARRKAVLAHGCEDARVHSRTSRLEDLQVRWPAILVDNHSHNNLGVIVD